MRLWSIHPAYLDSKGLTACWREALLAKAVLSGKTRGYRTHPQLERFRAHPDPLGAINVYLKFVYRESRRRGFSFAAQKIGRRRTSRRIPVTIGQARFELSHLKRKLYTRERRRYRSLLEVESPVVHPLFRVVAGGKESWERGGGRDSGGHRRRGRVP